MTVHTFSVGVSLKAQRLLGRKESMSRVSIAFTNVQVRLCLLSSIWKRYKLRQNNYGRPFRAPDDQDRAEAGRFCSDRT